MAPTYLDHLSMNLVDFSPAEGKQGKIVSVAPAGVPEHDPHYVSTQPISTV